MKLHLNDASNGAADPEAGRRPLNYHVKLQLRTSHPTAQSLPNLRSYLLTFITVCLLLLNVSCSSKKFSLSDEVFTAARQQYGGDAVSRLVAWQGLINEGRESNENKNLVVVNDFFNELNFVDDSIHWGVEDYWATPVEFLASNGGDCEDFALAKYFTLIAMGTSEEKINITYVRALRLNQAHMVVSFYPRPGAEPLVLDNIVPVIKLSSQRPDLLPVYSFNGSGLWLARVRGQGQKAGDSTIMKKWQDLLKRMPEGLLN